MRKPLAILFIASIALGFGLSRSKAAETIPPRGGETLTLAAIPTPNYLQTDPRWAEDTLGGTREKFANVGCTVCCLAMALDAHGVKVTPKALNDFLKKNGGFTERGWLKWESVPKFSQGKVVMGYIRNPSFQRIDAALKSNQPVIAKVLIDRAVAHWVLIVGKEKKEYLIHDPWATAKA